ncbi:hypothetical protein A3G67_01120 [Candidatus Roizmanbacteria bacterium RIFCSPLOWO2_12_FULL_40_12]|uniref:Uncharacterized protein n=1 Tax=Candidatus Roizmanbacteria bacterium RIFCSPLOWO2_01_FULL_40_42 TaxID=1802066 RepID=A0A1F7J237_9BACT|nr:MAG: hypothetical protein A2779_00840 [Candidatus Roizmanbacteria bacterium RIFCSPHIGHO2_01_FULL_40_98]OGK27594.1 MAG: hypothetical protein A3C31_02365 [Candidatus Roizmanbacteria bacterium RIFCSPHIGHO2_02_FULL_40_53]OGK30376.1 MAG: hypothetical protein A2W49_00650 [Candidatus Roizmanbacteria bacterium RIFCSPHIGHO2_12_41_18]OGK36148.1 MAG: hypothetical protein A3E69_01160 [Candidatus Roizmanbacteria bacterium RIFCSPHIGHO2_12_FULL_40_130]OGK49674.1 MAG: hypothetical protein A3B50_03015 [Candi
MSSIKKVLLGLLLFLFPVFFLTMTQEFFTTNKLYLLSFGALALLAVSTVGIIATKKVNWQSSPLEKPLLFFLVACAISIIFFSPNKVGALLNTNFGLLGIFSLIVFSMYLERARGRTELFKFLRWGALLLSLVTIFFFFQPFKNATLSPFLQFLRNPAFTPLGGRVDLAVFLGFFVVAGFADFFGHRRKREVVDIVSLVVITIAAGLTIFRIFTPETAQQAVLLPPYGVSWHAAVEVLKNPLNALFGVGMDNYSSIFTKAKDVAYNRTPFWTVNSFNISRSGLLQIFTETGILGFLAFGSVLLAGINHIKKGAKEHLFFSALFIYMLAVLLFLPLSFSVLFLFFVALSLAPQQEAETKHFNLGSVLPLYVLVAIIFVGVLGGMFYLVGRAYAAELAFRRSFVGFVNNSARDLYDNQRQAVILNPFVERFRTNFAQTNLLIATSIAQRAARAQGQDAQPKQLTKEERQTVTQAIQAAIQESKATVALNPQKAVNWENLATVYRSIIGAAKGADVWTVSSYQRAIILDPQNPIYRLNLGGAYYNFKNYPEAIRLFEQAVALKPDWANAYYNLAWANFQNGSYDRAIQSMNNVLKLVDKNKSPDDYKKVLSELEEFKKKLPKEGDQTSSTPGELRLPEKPQPELSPKVELPRNASPEAR